MDAIQEPSRDQGSRWRVLAAGVSRLVTPQFAIFVLFVLVAGASLVGYMNSLDGSQYALTRSIADRQAIGIGPYERYAWPDLAIGRAGRHVSDREPGTAILAVPFYLVGERMGPVLALPYNGSRPNLSGETKTEVITYLSVIVFVALGLAFACVALKRLGASTLAAFAACLLIGFGSLMWKYSASFARQPVVGVLLLVAVLQVLIYRKERKASDLALFGLFSGLAVFHDYISVIPLGLATVAVAVLERPPLKDWRVAAAAALPFLILILVYNYGAFGRLLTSPHQHEAQVTFMSKVANDFRTPIHLGLFLNLFSFNSVPREAVRWLLARPDVATQMGVEWALKNTYKGIFVQSPFLLLALGGWLIGSRGDRGSLTYPAAIIVSWLLLMSAFTLFWAPTQYDGRYVLPLVPTLGAGIVFYIDRLIRAKNAVSVVAASALGVAALISLYFGWESSVTNFAPNLSGVTRWPSGLTLVPGLTAPILKRAFLESFPNLRNVRAMLTLALVLYGCAVGLSGWVQERASEISSGVKMSDSLSGGFRSLWPSSTLARLMTIGIPLAAIITFVVVAPGYRGHAPAGPALTPPSQVASAPAVAAVEERNARRLSDLQDLGDALEGFVRQNPAYPSTGGGLQSLCTYETLDAGCALKKLRLDIPADPLGKNSGYWYLSDGSTFTVVSQWEGAGSPPDEYSCPPRVLALKRDSKLVCSSGPN